MTQREPPFRETAAEHRVDLMPLAHLSIELGHLSADEVARDPDVARRHFRHAVPWVAAAQRAGATDVPAGAARISTCVLIDDDVPGAGQPADVIPTIIQAAREYRVEIDYVARESACVEADAVPVARLLLDRLVEDPVPGTTGLGRQPVAHTGWLSNGQRSPATDVRAAMSSVEIWQPPILTATAEHPIFVDVQLWRDADRRVWSAAFRRAVWQMLRLDMLRHWGEIVANPRTGATDLPERWDDVPPILTVCQGGAAPFAAYRTLSILPSRQAALADAVNTILNQVAVEHTLLEAVRTSAVGEGIALPAALIDRTDYIFVTGVGSTGRSAAPTVS